MVFKLEIRLLLKKNYRSYYINDIKIMFLTNDKIYNLVGINYLSLTIFVIILELLTNLSLILKKVGKSQVSTN